MKNFMVIDGAANSEHLIFAVDDATFEIVFPDDTDIAFVDEVEERVARLGLDPIEFFNELYSEIIEKRDVRGLYGILHSTGSYCRKQYYPTRREADVRRG